MLCNTTDFDDSTLSVAKRLLSANNACPHRSHLKFPRYGKTTRIESRDTIAVKLLYDWLTPITRALPIVSLFSLRRIYDRNDNN